MLVCACTRICFYRVTFSVNSEGVVRLFVCMYAGMGLFVCMYACMGLFVCMFACVFVRSS
jgi:hypothetical protein